MSEKIETPSYYAIIPANVRYDDRLKANEKLLYGEITALSSANGICWATNGYFSKLYGVNKVTVSNWINKLIKLGYLYSEIIYKENSKEIEKRLLSIIKNVNSPINKNVNSPINKNVNSPINKNVNSPINKNVKDNNTSINNTRDNNTSINKGNYKNSLQKQMLDYFNFCFDKKFPDTMSGRFNSLVNSNISFNQFVDVVNYITQKWNNDITDNLTPNTIGNISKFEKYEDQAIGNGFVNTKDARDITEKNQEKKDKNKQLTKRLGDFEKVVEMYCDRFGYEKTPKFEDMPKCDNNQDWNGLLSGDEETYKKLKGIVENNV